MQLFIVHFFDVSSSFTNDIVGVFSTREKAIEYVRSTSEAEYADDEEFLNEYIEECTLDIPMLMEGDDGQSVKG